MLKCELCGNESPDGAQFCMYCGKDFPKAELPVKAPEVKPAAQEVKPPAASTPPPPPARPTRPTQTVPPSKGTSGSVRSGGPIFQLNGVGGQLYVYEDAVALEFKGALGFLNHGLKGTKRIPYESITSVQVKQGTNITNGYIQFGVVGGNESRQGLFAATKDENTVMFYKQDNDLAAEIQRFVERKKAALRSPAPAAPQPAASGADEILKYKQLLDAGIITQEEFDAKKRQILGI